MLHWLFFKKRIVKKNNKNLLFLIYPANLHDVAKYLNFYLVLNIDRIPFLQEFLPGIKNLFRLRLPKTPTNTNFPTFPTKY